MPPINGTLKFPVFERLFQAAFFSVMTMVVMTAAVTADMGDENDGCHE